MEVFIGATAKSHQTEESKVQCLSLCSQYISMFVSGNGNNLFGNRQYEREKERKRKEKKKQEGATELKFNEGEWVQSFVRQHFLMYR